MAKKYDIKNRCDLRMDREGAGKRIAPEVRDRKQRNQNCGHLKQYRQRYFDALCIRLSQMAPSLSLSFVGNKPCLKYLADAKKQQQQQRRRQLFFKELHRKQPNERFSLYNHCKKKSRIFFSIFTPLSAHPPTTLFFIEGRRPGVISHNGGHRSCYAEPFVQCMCCLTGSLATPTPPQLLDTNPREALRTLTPLEVKYPASQIVRSMRILALRKTGSHEKARELAAEFMKEPIAFADENVVHVMWWVLVELNLKADAVACLKLTNDVCQGQNSLVSETYFTALLWNRDLKEMQKQSMALNKRTKNQDYQVWSIMCNVLQVAPGDAKNMLLLLSNKMLEKIFAGDTAKLTRQLLWLHLYVMKRREQYDEALAFLDSKVARDLFPMDDERKAYVIEIYETTGAYAKANIAYKELLRSEHQRDNWFWWDGYFITLERLVAGEPTEEGADATWPSAEAFLGEVTSLEDAVVTNRLRRATPLAARHLLWLRVKAGLAEAADLVKSTASYIAWMKYKPQSHMDVAKFLPVIAEKGCAAALVDAIGSPSKPASDLVSLSHELAKHRAAFSLGLYNDISDEDLRAHLAAFIELSTASAPLSKDLEKTEKPYGDDALQLGALLLLNRFCRTDERRYLAQCLVLLELLPLPKNNTHLQQWQLLLPPLLGVNTQAAVSEELDIKFIQRESLTYMLHSTALSLGSEEEQTFLSQRVSSFHDRFDGHNGNIAISAWNKLACSKIFEMEQFRSALAASCVWRESAVENVLTQFLASTDTAHTRKVLDLIDRTVPNMSTTPQDNQDTKCVASTVLCAPESELSQTLTAKLLSSTHAPKDVCTFVCDTCFYELNHLTHRSRHRDAPCSRQSTTCLNACKHSSTPLMQRRRKPSQQRQRRKAKRRQQKSPSRRQLRSLWTGGQLLRVCSVFCSQYSKTRGA